ncbi:MAG: hypothetical protein SD837_00210 [Candidatus Electrothrix scaldis]|nr:MAG: hypothetical protein SD837_00210 [Candidatus Electrothrix sp. GW3-3]
MKSTLISLALTLGCCTLAFAAPPGNVMPSSERPIVRPARDGLMTLSQLFKCGPGFTTYSVKSSSGVSGDGVRCVKFHNTQTIDGKLTGVYWYGEGQWNGKTYRHIGYTYPFAFCPDAGGNCPPQYRSYAADISGNGENSGGEFSNLTLTSLDGNARIRVTGGWNEEWIREPSGHTATYSSKLKPVTTCGPHFSKASVADINGSTAGGTGVRCLASGPDGFFGFIWYGEGQWNGKKYRHLGFTNNFSNQGSGKATAADICNNSAFFCGQTAAGGLNIKQDPTACDANNKFKMNYVVTGNWKERWNGTDSVECPSVIR